MSENVWIVFGTSGEYSDRREWPVCVLPSEELARRYVDALDQQYQNIPPAWKKYYWDTEIQETIKAHMTLDPNFDHDYTGTSWYVMLSPQLTEQEFDGIVSKRQVDVGEKGKRQSCTARTDRIAAHSQQRSHSELEPDE